MPASTTEGGRRYFEVPYGLRFVGFRETERPRCSAITRVGVLPPASLRSCVSWLGVQGFPLFGGVLAMVIVSVPRYSRQAQWQQLLPQRLRWLSPPVCSRSCSARPCRQARGSAPVSY